MAKRITKTYRIMRVMYKTPNQFIKPKEIWRNTNFKYKLVLDVLGWLKKRGLAQKTYKKGYEENHPYIYVKYKLSKDGLIYMKRRAERERLEKLNPQLQEGEEYNATQED